MNPHISDEEAAVKAERLAEERAEEEYHERRHRERVRQSEAVS